MIVTPLFLSSFHCSMMPILWASSTMGFLRCMPRFHKKFLLHLQINSYPNLYINTLIWLMNQSVLIDKLLINLCIKYKYVLLLQSTEKKITIFLSVGILEHSPLMLMSNTDFAFGDIISNVFNTL